MQHNTDPRGVVFSKPLTLLHSL